MNEKLGISFIIGLACAATFGLSMVYTDAQITKLRTEPLYVRFVTTTNATSPIIPSGVR